MIKSKLSLRNGSAALRQLTGADLEVLYCLNDLSPLFSDITLRFKPNADNRAVILSLRISKFIRIYLSSRHFLQIVVVHSSCCNLATSRVEFSDNFLKKNYW